MTFNPSKQGSPLAPPTNSRKNSTNDPGFQNNLGYYPYDLSHTEVLASLFGMITPSMHLITNAGDRHVVKDDTKTILNKINGNFLNTINQYIDTVFVSNRTMFPNNWDKLIPNPVKGDDLPHSARPVVPLYAYFASFIRGQDEFTITVPEDDGIYDIPLTNDDVYSYLSNIRESVTEWDDRNNLDLDERTNLMYALANISFLSFIVSRGQMLDYLGVQFDIARTNSYESSLQYAIDTFYDSFYSWVYHNNIPLYNLELSPSTSDLSFVGMSDDPSYTVSTPSLFRERYMSCFERGDLFVPFIANDKEVDRISTLALLDAALMLRTKLTSLFLPGAEAPDAVDSSTDFNADGRCVNIMKPLAYQLSIAQYYTNDHVDNIFNSDLFMQLLRATMFPSVNGMSMVPTFNYNGVPTEYDYISYGAWFHSLIKISAGVNSRRFIVGSLLFILRRSLRYGDKFTTGRTRMLAVGQLGVPVDGDMSVNPVDITLGLITQRYLHAANRVGNKPLDYYAGILGVVPSDMPSIPRYVGHRKIEFENRVTTNTAQDQGEQTTNLVGYSDNMGFDVYIDDYGVILSLNSYDVLPIYTSGIDAENFLSDRFEFFNPMMQNIGDEPIRMSELVGDISLYDDTFAYTVRDSAYKYKLSKAHGALCYNMPGFLLKFPTYLFDMAVSNSDVMLEHIDPDFIRDKPSLLDSIISFDTGISPGRYFHFIVSVNNTVKSARTIQKAPAILF